MHRVPIDPKLALVLPLDERRHRLRVVWRHAVEVNHERLRRLVRSRGGGPARQAADERRDFGRGALDGLGRRRPVGFERSSTRAAVVVEGLLEDGDDAKRPQRRLGAGLAVLDLKADVRPCRALAGRR